MFASITAVISAVQTGVSLIETLAAAGKNIAPAVDLFKQVFYDKTEVAQSDLDAFIAESERLYALTQEPIPPEED